jgi:hypothetical protein
MEHARIAAESFASENYNAGMLCNEKAHTCANQHGARPYRCVTNAINQHERNLATSLLRLHCIINEKLIDAINGFGHQRVVMKSAENSAIVDLGHFRADSYLAGRLICFGVSYLAVHFYYSSPTHVKSLCIASDSSPSNMHHQLLSLA